MALYNVVWYSLHYFYETKTHSIKITYEEENTKKTVDLPVDLPHLAFIVDMMRNEKPIWYNTNEKCLQTGTESIGEGEKIK
jgi:hypothetical protein